jgi:hypothetical protein
MIGWMVDQVSNMVVLNVHYAWKHHQQLHGPILPHVGMVFEMVMNNVIVVYKIALLLIHVVMVLHARYLSLCSYKVSLLVASLFVRMITLKQLLAGKECSLIDPCCTSSCTIATDSRVCRASVHSECDFADQCDGTVATCPADFYATAGTSCTWYVYLCPPFPFSLPTYLECYVVLHRCRSISGQGSGSGVCYTKSCLSHAQQCFTIGAAAPEQGIAAACNNAGDSSGATSCSQPLACSLTSSGAAPCYKYVFIRLAYSSVLFRLLTSDMCTILWVI